MAGSVTHGTRTVKFDNSLKLDTVFRGSAFYLNRCYHLFQGQGESAQPVKIHLDKKLDSKEKTNQAFNIDAKGFRKTRNENLQSWDIGITS